MQILVAPFLPTMPKIRSIVFPPFPFQNAGTFGSAYPRISRLEVLKIRILQGNEAVRVNEA